MRKAFNIIILILLVFTCACSGPQTTIELVPSPEKEEPKASDSTGIEAPSPTKKPEPVYLIGTIVKLEDEFTYIRAKNSKDSSVICAASLGINFVIMNLVGNWYRVLYDDSFGYIEKQYLEEKDVLCPAPIHKSYTYLSEKEEIGFVHHKYNGKIKVVSASYTEDGTTKQKIDVYTENGTLLASNASLVIKEATITAPPIIETLETETEITSSPKPISIKIKSGKIVSAKGIELSKESGFVIGKDKGRVITEDKTVIFYDNAWLSGAEFSVKEAKIYSKAGTFKLESDYYYVPALLKDELVDVAYNSQDISIDMLFAKDENLLDENVYGEQICLLQKGTLEKLKKASELFKTDGYEIIIYDAYRPYSVTVMLYDKYKDGTYVAPPRFGSLHNKGAAIDMSLLDSDGNVIIMPSPIHTLNSSSNRDNKNMSKTAKANMDYMTNIMKECGFSTIKSEWWHFSDTDANDYLRTDYDFGTLLKVVYE